MGKKKNIVCVKNEVLNYSYANFSVNECRLWFALLAQVRDCQSNIVEISFDDFSEITGITRNRPQYIEEIFFNMSSKIQALTEIRVRENGISRQRWFFDANDVNIKERKIIVSVNSQYVAYVSGLLRGFTKFKLSEFTLLKTRAAQELYLQLKKNAFKEDGCIISLKELRDRLDLYGYKTKDITSKILKPAVNEINWMGIFDRDISFKTIKNGKNIVAYKFEFGQAEEIIDEEEAW